MSSFNQQYENYEDNMFKALHLSQCLAVYNDLIKGTTPYGLEIGWGTYHRGGQWNLYKSSLYTQKQVFKFLYYIWHKYDTTKSCCKKMINDIKPLFKFAPNKYCYCKKKFIYECNCSINQTILQLTCLIKMFLVWWNIQVEIYPYVSFYSAINNIINYDWPIENIIYDLSHFPSNIIYQKSILCFDKHIFKDTLDNYKQFSSGVNYKICAFIILNYSSNLNFNIDILDIISKTLIHYSNMNKIIY